MTTWHILGAGSLGSLWAIRLHRAGFPVRLILRNETRLQQYQKAGGIFLQEKHVHRRYDVPVEAIGSQQPIERLLLACKTYDVETALEGLQHRLAAPADLIMLQNGVATQHAVTDRYPMHRCYFASSTEGAFRVQDFHVVQAGRGHTSIGSPGCKTLPTWLTDLHIARIPYSWVDNIEELLWRKLAINCAINPLTVLHQCQNGKLEAHRDEIALLCEDLGRLLESIGLEGIASTLFSDVMHVIETTAENFSSMHQDVAAGRRTEVNFLLGYACREGERLGLALPHLQSLEMRLRRELQQHGLPDS